MTAAMKRILLTGMSGTGKTTVVRELAARGYKAIDSDDEGWSHWVNMQTGRPATPPAPGEFGWDELDWLWNEERIERLLSTADAGVLFLTGTAPNMSRFLAQFDHIILLSAPAQAIVERLSGRKDNPYGTTPRSLARVLEHLQTVEPQLREIADQEIVTTIAPEAVVERVLQIALGRP